MTNILIPIDGSAYGKVITDFLVNHRWTANTQLRLCHAVEPLADDLYADGSLEKSVHKSAQKMLESLAEKISLLMPSAQVSQVVRRGEAEQEILNEAENWPADLIVLGSHSHHDPHKSRFGSVALSVLAKTHATAIIVRVPPQKIKELALQAEPERLRARYKFCDTHM